MFDKVTIKNVEDIVDATEEETKMNKQFVTDVKGMFDKVKGDENVIVYEAS